MKSYSQKVVISAPKEAAINAFTKNVEKWWGKVDKPASLPGDVFKVSFGEAYWKFKVVDMQNEERISWECVEAHQVHRGLEGMEEEWLETRLHWKILPIDEHHTEVHFEHQGLVPSFICYDVCSSAWDYFIKESLKNYLEKGNGSPEIH